MHGITVSARKRVPHLPLLQLLLQLADLSLCHRIIDAPSSLARTARTARTLGEAVDRQLLEKFAKLRQLHLCRKSRREMQERVYLRARHPGARGKVKT